MTTTTPGSRPERFYWICQAAGWGSFLVYVLGFYLVWAHPKRGWDIVSIIVVNGVLCPTIAHALRGWIHSRRWLALSLRQLVPRLVATVITISGALTTLVILTIVLIDGDGMPRAGAIGTLAAFCWAFTGWLVIYYVVHARRRHEARQLELTSIAREAQLQALRAQLNPHFLFNCLNSLRHLIIVDSARATSMVDGLAALLRYSLSSDRKDLVSLAEELRIVDEYLDLEGVRLEERLQVQRSVDPDVLGAQIPPMLLQTLVDNAIKHGIADLPKGGTIRIEARAIGPNLQLIITNTGSLKSQREGHGLRSATARLRLLYGSSASLTLRDLDGLTEAALTVPLVQELASERIAR